MKQIAIAFIVALVVGSFLNGMNSGNPGGGGSPDAAQASSAAANDPTVQAGLSLVANVDEGSFQGYVLDSHEPVLVEFYTDRCPHCVSMQPILGKLAYNGQGVVRLCRVNAEKSSALAQRYNVEGVPAFCLFAEGHLVDFTSGARDIEGMKSWLAVNNIKVPDAPRSN